MTCETYRELIAAHVDGSLRPVEWQDVDRHLADCAPCAKLFADQKRFRQIARSWQCEAPIPLAVEYRLRLAVATENSPLGQWWQKACEQLAFMLRPAQSVFLVATAVLLLLTFMQPQERVRSQEYAAGDATTAYYRAAANRQFPYAYVYFSDDPRGLEKSLNYSGHLNFAAHVMDLRPVGYQLRKGMLVETGEELAVVTAYEDEDGDVMWLRQRESAFPIGTPKLQERELLRTEVLTKLQRTLKN
jgi:hypothetical protein